MEPARTPAIPDERFWTSSDPLAEILHLMRMSGVFYSVSEMSAPWGADMPPIPDTMMFHFVTEGLGWLEVEGEPARILAPGTLALVPHGRGHRIVSAAGGESVDIFALPREELSERYEFIRIEGPGETTRLVCGAVHFDDPAARRLVEFLPRVIYVNTWDDTQLVWLRSTLNLMSEEARDLKPGGETIVTRLADVLVIQTLRSWITNGACDATDASRPGWLRACRDPQIGRAIACIHRDPAQDWSVDTLARAIGMSRSGFAARFRELTGETPMQYVTTWRMSVATAWLREERVSLLELAERLGYRSEAAFCRAFKRTTGMSPGQVRREARV